MQGEKKREREMKFIIEKRLLKSRWYSSGTLLENLILKLTTIGNFSSFIILLFLRKQVVN